MADADRTFESRSTTIKIPITPRRLPALIKAGWALRKGFKGQDLDAERPEFVMLDGRSSAILERAQDLAADDREDPQAVAEITAVAGRHEWALRLAALGARQWGQHRESSIPNLAHRLLQAAISGRPVEQLGDGERRRLEALDDFTDLDNERSWQTLIDREPRLRELEADARTGRFGRLRGLIDETMTTDEKQQIARERLEGLSALKERLDPLVGPHSSSEDILLGSHIAHELAHVCIVRGAPSVDVADE